MGQAMRGIINLRGQTLPVIDLRLLLGQESLANELHGLVGLLSAREEDHRRWVETLKQSIRQQQPFPLTLDPTQCAFGKWYANFRTDNTILEHHLKRFDEPHRQLHQAGHDILKLCKEGKQEEAMSHLSFLEQTTMRTLIGLFGEARHILESDSRELIAVVKQNGMEFGLTVDAIDAVDSLSRVEPLPQGTASALVAKTGRLGKQQSVLMLLELGRIWDIAQA